MKVSVFFVTLLALAIALCLLANAEPVKTAKCLSDEICAAIPTEFGYVDNTSYALANDFSSLNCVGDVCVVVCAESTNFNEIGVFYVNDPSDVKACANFLQRYLRERKHRFENGVIYDVKEYPKFENATVTVSDHYVVYTILDRESTFVVKDILKNNLK